MNLNILANAKFGWIFVISEIIIFYTMFLFLHRIVEKAYKNRKH